MAPDRCWSSIVVGPADSALLGLRPGGSSLVGCDLSDGHSGLHSSDGGRGGTVRRAWVMWGDYARGPQAGRILDPCHGISAAGSACTLYEGHGGAHRFLAAPVAAPDPLTPPPRYSASPPSYPIPAASVPSAPFPAAPSSAAVWPTQPAPRARHGLAEAAGPGAPRVAPPAQAPTAAAAPIPAGRSADPLRTTVDPVRRGAVPDPSPSPPKPATPPSAPQTIPVVESHEPEETVTDEVEPSKHGKQKPAKHGKGKGKGRNKGSTGDFPAPPPPASAGPEVRVSDLRDLGSLLQVNEYADRSRTSFIEVIESDGSSRTVVAPVSAAPQTASAPATPSPTAHRHARVADSVPENEDRFAELSTMNVTTVAASTAAASQAVESVSAAVEALPDEQLLVRQQVGEALRDVAAALSKLAESLDPR